MSFYVAKCSNCGYKSNKFFRGIIGKEPGFYFPVACKSTKKIVSRDIYSKQIFGGEKFECAEEDIIDYSKDYKSAKKECPSCGERTLQFKLVENIKLG